MLILAIYILRTGEPFELVAGLRLVGPPQVSHGLAAETVSDAVEARVRQAHPLAHARHELARVPAHFHAVLRGLEVIGPRRHVAPVQADHVAVLAAKQV